MRINNPSKVLIVFGVLFCVSLPLSNMNAQEYSDAYKYYNECDKARGQKESEINSAKDDLGQFEDFRSRIEGYLSENVEDLRDGVRTTLISAGFADMGAATAALANGTMDMMDGIALLSSFNSANSAISSQNGVISGLYTDPPSTPIENRTGYDAVYNRYVDAYNNLSASDKAIVRKAKGSDGPYPKKDQPSGSTYGLVACARPSSLSPTCYGYYTDANSHKHTCAQKHGTSGTTNIDTWLCFSSICTRSSEHWVPCRATNCSVLFPPPTITIIPPDFPGGSVYTVKTYHDHEVTCQAYYYRGFFASTVCGDKYFTCEGSCDNGHSSGSGSNPPSSGGSNPPSNTPTPSYHACNVHLTTVSGDHSLQSSCSSSNANGNCTVTSFYACDSHTHAYPTPPPTPTPPPPPEPTPPPPTTVACGAASWTGCTASVSSRTEHKIPSCSGCGNRYWTCSASASNHTDVKTCRYSECRQQWKKCASAPVCNKPYRKRNGLKCWAQ